MRILALLLAFSLCMANGMAGAQAVPRQEALTLEDILPLIGNLHRMSLVPAENAAAVSLAFSHGDERHRVLDLGFGGDEARGPLRLVYGLLRMQNPACETDEATLYLSLGLIQDISTEACYPLPEDHIGGGWHFLGATLEPENWTPLALYVPTIDDGSGAPPSAEADWLLLSLWSGASLGPSDENDLPPPPTVAELRADLRYAELLPTGSEFFYLDEFELDEAAEP